MWREAMAGATIIVAANWFLQPLANRMDRVHTAGRSREVAAADYLLQVMCTRESSADIKASISTALPSPQFRLRALRTRSAHALGHVEVEAEYSTAARDDESAETAVRALSQQDDVTSVSWRIADERAADWTR
jgi:putative Mg2+ transporter-C (MgtC) family protein